MYEHKVKYYETDQMAIAHHSNYIRWMEEARFDFLERSGFDCAAMEKRGIVMPIVSVACDYIGMTRFNDTVLIDVKVRRYTGARVELYYDIKDKKSGELRARGGSVNCFMSGGKVRALPRISPELDVELKRLADAVK